MNKKNNFTFNLNVFHHTNNNDTDHEMEFILLKKTNLIITILISQLMKII